VRRIPVLITMIILLSACSRGEGTASPSASPTLPEPGLTSIPAPSPDETARRFLEAWRSEDFAAMYDQLSPLTQDGLSLEEFSNRYAEIHSTAALTNVDFQIVSSLVVSPYIAEVRYRVTLTSAVVGDITREVRMDLSRDLHDQEWKVAWTPATIMPKLETDNGLRLYQNTPTRANIYDRNGKAFAVQEDAVALYIIPNQIGDDDAEASMLRTLRNLLDLATDGEISFRYENRRDTDFYTALGEVALTNYRSVEGRLDALGGVEGIPYSTRFYPGGGLTPFSGGYAPHSVGYVGWIQPTDLENYLARGYRQDEYVGQMGLEFAYEDELRGQAGGTLYLVNSSGQDQELVAARDPEPPYAVYSTLDRDLQRYAQQAIEDFVGAIVVLERDTGAVLAMVSSPGFDPNLFDTNNSNSAYVINDLFQNPNIPLLNRATHGLYPPGSVFKIITMAAALESGLYTPETIYSCGHYFTELEGITLTDWRLEKELPAAGDITLMQGLEMSCNPYFWHIGLDLFVRDSPTAIPDMAKLFGLGQPTGIEIGDDGGWVPDPESKLARIGEEWMANDPVQMAIGQGFLQVTPLQVARYVAAIGNGGTLYQPQLVLRVENAEGDIRQEFEGEEQGRLPLSPENIEAIQIAMANVVSEPYATAYRKFLGLNLNVAGKTGTATTGDFTDPHAWFVGYTFEEREDKPDIAIAVVVEQIGEGSDWAAPIFRRVTEAYFKGGPQYLYPWEARIRVPKTPTPTPGVEESDVEETPTP
jgi:penicillin-binding protein 2